MNELIDIIKTLIVLVTVIAGGIFLIIIIPMVLTAASIILVGIVIYLGFKDHRNNKKSGS